MGYFQNGFEKCSLFICDGFLCFSNISWVEASPKLLMTKLVHGLDCYRLVLCLHSSKGILKKRDGESCVPQTG